MRLKRKDIGTLFLPLISYGLKIGMFNALPFVQHAIEFLWFSMYIDSAICDIYI